MDVNQRICSFCIGAKYYACAVDGLITESERSPVIETCIPQAFRSYSQSLPFHVSVKYLNSDLISGHFELFNSGSDHPSKILCHISAFGRVKGCTFQLFVEDSLDNFFDAAGEKPFVFFGFELECVSTLSHLQFQYQIKYKIQK